MPKFRCPRCQHMNQEPDDRIGLVVLCQGCQQKLRVPVRKPELRQDVLQTSSSIATDALAAPADINELPTLEPNDEVRSHERIEQSDEPTYQLQLPSLEYDSEPLTCYRLSVVARDVIDAYHVLAEIEIPKQPRGPQRNFMTSVAGGVGNFIEAFVNQLLGLGFLAFFFPVGRSIRRGPLRERNLIAESPDGKMGILWGHRPYREWKKHCEQEAAKKLQEKGFPTHPIKQLEQLVQPLKSGDVNPLIVLFEAESNTDVRRAAIVAMSYLGPFAAAAVPLLRRVIQDRDKALCKLAIITLGRIGRPAEPAVPELLDGVLQLGSRFPAVETLEAIKSIEPLPKRAWPAIVQGLCDADTKRRQHVMTVFRSATVSVGTSATAPLLVAALEQAHPSQRHLIQQALQLVSPIVARRQPEKLRRHSKSVFVRIVRGAVVLFLVLFIGFFVLALIVTQRDGLPARDSTNSASRPVISGLVSEAELAEFLPWTPPDGWQRGGAGHRTGMLGGKFLTFHMTSSAFPSIDVKCDFKRESISEAEMIARLKRTTSTANTVGGDLRWLPAKSLGRRTVHVIDGPNTNATSLRQYRWLISERSIECTVAVSGNPTVFAAAVAVIEPSLEAAIAGHDPSTDKPAPDANSPPIQSDAEPKSNENKPVPTPDSPSSGTDPRDADAPPTTIPTKSDSPKTESSPLSLPSQ